MLKLKSLIGLWLLFAFSVAAQPLSTLTLSDAYDMLEKQYPSLQDAGVLQQIHQKDLDLLEIAKKPALSLKADGRLQSESVSLKASDAMMVPFEINQPIISVKSYVDAQYMIIDGGLNDVQKKLKTVQLEADLQNIKVEEYTLRQRINNLFVGISLLREQSKLFDISLENLRTRKERISAGIDQGVLLESEKTQIEVKELELLAQKDNVSHQISGFVQSLAFLVGESLSEEISLEFSSMPSPDQIPEIQRPEQQLFKLKREAILARADLIEVESKPKLAAFAQAGVGYPNPLNLLDAGFSPYGMIGVQLNWRITDWKKGDSDRELLSLQAQKLNHAEEAFDFNLKSREAFYLSEVERLRAQIQNDEKIALLQTKILEQLTAQLDEGVITSTEYIIQVNAELAARQNLAIHQTELLKTQLEFWNQRGGF